MNENTVPFTGRTLRGELALLVAVCINSLGVVLMLYSGAGISAISSVPFAFSEVFPKISLGTWTYLFQGLLVLSLMILRRKFVPSYLFSFVVGFVFGDLLDKHVRFISVLTKRKEREQDTAHPLTLHVTYTAFPGKRDDFLQAVQEARIPEITRQEAGCLQYDYCVSEENPDQVLLTEQWATEAQQQAHLKQPHMQRQQQIKQTCIAETAVEKC